MALPSGTLWSVRRLCQEFELNRQTVIKRIEGIKPAGVARGFPAYKLNDVALAILGYPNPDPDDPTNLKPMDRRAYYQSENERLKVAEAEGDLIPKEDLEDAVSKAFKSLATTLDTLPDVLERDVGMDPDQVTTMIRVLDTVREDMYRNLVAAYDEFCESDTDYIGHSGDPETAAAPVNT